MLAHCPGAARTQIPADLYGFASRYPEAVPLRRVDAKTVSDALIEIFSRFGIPEEILSDNGSAFTATLTQTLLKILGVKTLKISPYHLQSNGTLERWHGPSRQWCPS